VGLHPLIEPAALRECDQKYGERMNQRDTSRLD
jgi:hypothetical protein